MIRVVRAPQVIKLSDAIQPLPRSTTEFVHGVARGFLAVGRASAQQRGYSLGAAGACSVVNWTEWTMLASQFRIQTWGDR